MCSCKGQIGTGLYKPQPHPTLPRPQLGLMTLSFSSSLTFDTVWHLLAPCISLLEMNERKFNDSWRLQVMEDGEGVTKHSRATAVGSRCESWAWRNNGRWWGLEPGRTWGSGRRLLLGSCSRRGGGGDAASLKPQQGRAMKGFTHLFSLPSSPAVPPIAWAQSEQSRRTRGTGQAGERGSVDPEKRRRMFSTLPPGHCELLTVVV